MTDAPRTACRPGLPAIAFRWILVAAALGLIIQTLICLGENLLNEDYFTRNFVSAETGAIAKAISISDGKVEFKAPDSLPYFSDNTGAYGFRVTDRDGQVLAVRNETLITGHPPHTSGEAAHFWYSKTKADWLHLAGGSTRKVDGGEVWIDVATAGDPQWRRIAALMHELRDDVWIPLIPTLFFTTLFLMYRLHRILKPLEDAASQARSLDVEHGLKSFNIADMPREAANLADGMNALMHRVDGLVRSREHLASFVAHEVKTPLASMLLELEQIVDKRARRLEEDVMALNETVDSVLTFGRQDSVAVESVCLETIARDCVERARAKARCGRVISLTMDRPAPFAGFRLAALHAVQNVIENALTHTPASAPVHVTCGPGPVVTVEDGGPGLTEEDAARIFGAFERGRTDAGGTGLGLAIVKRAMELNRGSVETGRSRLGGACFRLRFASAAAAAKCRAGPASDLARRASQPAS